MHQSLAAMLQDIKSQPTFSREAWPDLNAQAARALASSRSARAAKKIYLVGCGDSFYAGIATRFAFEKLGGVHAEAMQALEFSRYPSEIVDYSDTVVIAISNSGEVARTIECALVARSKGALVIGVTRDPESRLARAADEVVEVKLPSSVGVVPGTRSYLGSMLALYAIAVNLGLERGALDACGKANVDSLIESLSVGMEQTVGLSEELIDAYVQQHSIGESAGIHILGSGPNFGTAQFGTMKLVEACAVSSIPQGIEEWAHSQYFVTRPGTQVIFVAAGGNSHDRALEVMRGVKTVGGTVIAIAESNDHKVRGLADFVWPVEPAAMPEEFSPIIYSIPLELLAYYLAVKLDAAPLDFDGKPDKRDENFRQIFHSKIISSISIPSEEAR